MNKRISSRGVIIDGDYVYLIFRRKIFEDGTIKEYYVIPGGGVEGGETLEETVLRELKEELSIDAKIIEYLGSNSEEDAYLFLCEIVDGIPKLGGNEAVRNSEKNYYEIVKVNINSLNEIDIYFRDKILKGYNIMCKNGNNKKC